MRVKLTGLAGKDAELFWSTGELEKAKPLLEMESILLLLHYSTTPLLPPHVKKIIDTTLAVVKPSASGFPLSLKSIVCLFPP